MTQNERLIAFLREHGSITRAEAFSLSIANLWARIAEIEKAPYCCSIWHEDGVVVSNQYGQSCRVTRYHLQEPTPYG